MAMLVKKAIKNINLIFVLEFIPSEFLLKISITPASIYSGSGVQSTIFLKGCS